MDFVVVGRGAVGAVLGASLEHAGHRVSYVVRDGTHCARELSVKRVGSHERRYCAGQTLTLDAGTLPSCECWLVCVRSEQLARTLRQLAPLMTSNQHVVIATVSLTGARASAEAAGVPARVLALHVSFGAWSESTESRRVNWFPFRLPTVISAEAETAQLTAARAFAHILRAAGIPAFACTSWDSPTRLIMAVTTALLPAWELCGWSPKQLASEPELRGLCASALGEAITVVTRGQRGLQLLAATPRAAYALLLWILPWLMTRRARELWLHHGPKLHDQTAHALRELIALAAERQLPAPGLGELQRRCEGRVPRA